ncbi:hypothetical protein MA16_Dca020988 [Dendrobium catenatum]|uniref:Uncharacterized protein n=1 Tax=Dendrobium catenatum TaxID=906689 RepID=A0A2I0W5S8_9ASPA|nr:hypothetical protein MA16_Dca020988 [Dendrobium catenatum]
MLDAQADVPLAGWPWAQLAFKDSMVRGILQFAPHIAFRCALHRCESRDIHCRESCQSIWRATTPHPTKPIMGLCFKIPLALRCADFRVHPSFITSTPHRGDEAMTPVDFISAARAAAFFNGFTKLLVVFRSRQ